MEKKKKRLTKTYIKENWVLYLLLIPVIIFFVVYHFMPMFNMKMAFQDFKIFGGSKWIGFKNFNLLFTSPIFTTVLKNTVVISLLKLILIFPIPIILSIFINELKTSPFKKFIQTSIYLPHFLSWVIIAGIWVSFLSPTGAVNEIISMLGYKPIDFMTNKAYIKGVLVVSEAWRSVGWDSIIYLAAIIRISHVLYEAAGIDGASRWQQVKYITLPALYPTIITVLILNLGFFMNAGFDQVYNFMNDSVISSIDILDTYVYRIGLKSGAYSVSAAASFFKGVIGLFLIICSHLFSKKVSGKGLW